MEAHVPQHDARGSWWRRWDPQIHTPGTALNDQYGAATLDDFLVAIESATPSVSALGVTDYYSTASYDQVIQAKSVGRLPTVDLIFPSIELRLSVGTSKGSGVNLHLLVSPDDPDHVKRINRFLARLTFQYKSDSYTCTPSDLAQLGRIHKSSVANDRAAYCEGVNQFKVDFDQLREEFTKNHWVQDNVLIAVAAGSTDGTSGLRDPGASFAALRKELETFSHIIFSGSMTQRDFWLGEGPLSPADVIKEYGRLRPCIHGSDAHSLAKVAKPDLDRFSWIKGDAAFDSLRQACIEPASRVFVGPVPPEVETPERTISRVFTKGASWLLDDGLTINPGLVAIIGARGSGKTALVDLLAHGGGSHLPLRGEDSFLNRATPFLGGVDVGIEWSTGESVTVPARSVPNQDDEDVHYLSQQFVERLCSSEGLTDELIAEIEKVVFSSHPASTRLGATTFAELLDAHLGDTQLRRQYLRERMDRLSEEVLTERTNARTLPSKQKQVTALEETLKKLQDSRGTIVRKGEEERAAYYTRLRTAIDDRTRRIQAFDATLQLISHLVTEVSRYRKRVFADLTDQLKKNFSAVGLREDDWAAFAIDFVGDPLMTLDLRKNAVAAEKEKARTGTSAAIPSVKSTPEDLGVMALDKLEEAFRALSTAIGVDKDNVRKLKNLNERIAQTTLQLEKIRKEVEHLKGSQDRMKALAKGRSDAYLEYFELVVHEQESLTELYDPLSKSLGDTAGSVQPLKFVVVRNVDVGSWASRGEDLLDLRKNGRFRGRGALAAFAREKLLPSWQRGSAEDVSAAMEQFRGEFDQALIDQALVERDSAEYQQWTLDVGRWLYSVDHIHVAFSFEYDGIALSQLSPGSRGIVLLLLYLALDLDDHRPLIIDQPEENLDPRSVFRELVELFRSARTRRQVIVVTHNANLVVNTDVDQVIVANCTRPAGGKPPTFSYESGGLENAAIRTQVCEILEGGEVAFRERAKRLRVSF